MYCDTYISVWMKIEYSLCLLVLVYYALKLIVCLTLAFLTINTIYPRAARVSK